MFIKQKFMFLVMMVFILPMVGCQTMKDPGVIAVTGTTIGLEIAQNSGTGSPQSTFGYKRSEVAIVSKDKLKDGKGDDEKSEDVANVVMELRYSRDGDSPGIYQRLAVGKKAVAGKGAAFMFAKKADGSIDADAAGALQQVFSETDPGAGLDP